MDNKNDDRMTWFEFACIIIAVFLTALCVSKIGCDVSDPYLKAGDQLMILVTIGGTLIAGIVAMFFSGALTFQALVYAEELGIIEGGLHLPPEDQP